MWNIIYCVYIFIALVFSDQDFCKRKFSDGELMLGAYHKSDSTDLRSKQRDEVGQLLAWSFAILEKYNEGNELPLYYMGTKTQFQEIYTQVVSGLNFCVTFYASTTQCKKGQGCKAEYLCSGTGYQALPVLIRGVPAMPEPEAESVECEAISKEKKENFKILRM